MLPAFIVYTVSNESWEHERLEMRVYVHVPLGGEGELLV